MRIRAGWVVPALLFCGATGIPAQTTTQDLKQLSIEELMQVNVTLAARRPEPVATTPAAISVITGDDIRRAGVTTIADAIALADGVEVARFNNGTWSITARGFNAVTANKMLVMIDGRTVYSPLFSGVFWTALDYVLEDIDRIEVIRGPGATLWGANAVNGVVNIITRSARDTRGTYVRVGGGGEDPGIAEVRYGGGTATTAFRGYGKYAARGSQQYADASSAGDRRVRGQAGFRVDGGSTGSTSWFLKGDLFHSIDDLPDRPNAEFTTGDLQVQWSDAISSRSNLQVRSYFNHEYRRVPLQFTHHLNTVDVDVQDSYTLTRHSLVFGGGYRYNHDDTLGTDVLTFDPRSRPYPIENTFVQDDVALLPRRLYVTAGIKYERNAFNGGAWQPDVRARLLLPRQQMLWGSVAHAVRRPTRFDDDIIVKGPTGAVLIVGNKDFLSESLVASEIGYRLQPSAFFSGDATFFIHHYDNLRSQDAQPGASPFPLVIGNSLEGRSRGVELALNVQPVRWWRSHLSYTRLDVSVTKAAGSRDVGGGATEANDPPYIVQFRNSLDLPRHLEADARIRSVAALPNPVVPAFTEMAARLGWRPTLHLELAVEGEDLLHDRHAEFNPVARGFEEFERSVRLMLTTRF